MANNIEILLRFYTSIGLDPSDFDLELLSCVRNKDKDNEVQFRFRKASPWTIEQYEEFSKAISSLSYPATFEFSYLTYPSPTEIVDFFKAWHQSLFHLPFDGEVSATKKEVNFIFASDEDLAQNQYRLDEFACFLQFLNYSFKVTGSVQEVS